MMVLTTSSCNMGPMAGRLQRRAFGSLSQLALCASALTFSATAVQAQEASNAASESDALTADAAIVVTANKRSERLQDVPSAINVVSSAQLATAGVTRLEDLAKVSPAIAITGSSGALHSTIAVRGIYTNNVSPGIPSAVGIVVDDIPQPPDSRGFNELADIERIEVLRGPQSTISGRNAAAGLINIVTQGPTETLTIDAGVTATTDQEYRGSLFVAGPLAQNVSGSLSGYYTNWDGNVHNRATGKDLGKESYGIRGKLEVRPAAGLTIQAAAYFQKLNEEQGTAIYQRFAPTAALLGNSALPPSVAIGTGIEFDGRNQTINSTVPTFQRTRSHGGSLRGTLELGDMQLVSITGYQKEHVDASLDLFGINSTALSTAFGSWGGNQTLTVSTKTKSQEFRLVSPNNGRLTYVLGLFYLDTSVGYDFTRAVFAPFSRDRTSSYRNYAAYARGTFKFTDQLLVTGGVRYNNDEIKYTIVDRLSALNSRGESSDDAVLGDVSLQYKPTTDVMFYGRFARGRQAQAYDLDAPISVGQTLTPLAAGKVDSFELGAKTQLFDRRLTFNAALFNTEFYNYLAQSRIQTLTSIILQLVPVGRVRSRGFELDANFKATDRLQLNFSAAHSDSIFRDFASAACYPGQTVAQGCVNTKQDLRNTNLPISPKWALAGGAEYRLPIDTLPFDVSLRADATYQSKVVYELSKDPATAQSGYAIVNLSLNLIDRDNRYKVSAFINNLTDKEHYNSLLNFANFYGGGQVGTAVTTRSLPRDFRRYGGIRLSYSF